MGNKKDKDKNNKDIDKEIENSETCKKGKKDKSSDKKKLTPEEQIENLEEQLEEVNNKILYLQADYQNYRKRVVKDLSDARAAGVVSTLEPFLQVFDYLKMARQAAETSDNIDSIRQGITMIIDEYGKAFEELGVESPKSIGEDFNPSWQEAVANEASDTVEEGKVISEWSPAYRIGERLLRVAKVVVSSGKDKGDSGEKEGIKVDE